MSERVLLVQVREAGLAWMVEVVKRVPVMVPWAGMRLLGSEASVPRVSLMSVRWALVALRVPSPFTSRSALCWGSTQEQGVVPTTAVLQARVVMPSGPVMLRVRRRR